MHPSPFLLPCSLLLLSIPQFYRFCTAFYSAIYKKNTRAPIPAGKIAAAPSQSAIHAFLLLSGEKKTAAVTPAVLLQTSFLYYFFFMTRRMITAIEHIYSRFCQSLYYWFSLNWHTRPSKVTACADSSSLVAEASSAVAALLCTTSDI